MRPLPRSARAALVLLAVLLTPLRAAAATLGSALPVTAEVAPSCRVSGTTAGGSVAEPAGADSSGVALTCTKGVLAVVSPRQPGEGPSLLRAAGAGGSALLAIDRRGGAARPRSTLPGGAPPTTTIHF